MNHLSWLPSIKDWRKELREITGDASERQSKLLALSRHKLDFIQTNFVDSMFAKLLEDPDLGVFASNHIRLALLGSCTLAQLHSAIRISGLRRDIKISIYEGEYGQYWQELTDSASSLHKFRPNVILLAFDAYHMTSAVNATSTDLGVNEALRDVLARIRACWQLARDAFGCSIIQQTVMPAHHDVLGNNEHRLAGSKSAFVGKLNVSIRAMADEMGVDVLALDARVTRDGIAKWHDAALWHRAKQEVIPLAAPMYGEMVGRLIGAKLGKSSKCLVVDLDNTLWGGVIGDDGLGGIVLGQGSALGEAHIAFQEYLRELSRRGVLLAVCSKNDEKNALAPFEMHPEMVLKKGDIACFIANWSDKATNIRTIASQLNIGIESLVFVDDNPFERDLVRRELPMVAVPEVGDDPSYFAATIADAGYFEGLAITQEDRDRVAQYQSNQLRDVLKSSSTDLSAYLRSLDMELAWSKFGSLDVSRIVQLINKTNQFNLTTKRYVESDVYDIMNNDRAFGLQFRLSDRFGDNGIIAVVIGKMLNESDLVIDTWLMSCRVLGRDVETTTLNIISEQARNLGARRLIGEYVPTAKNSMVREHYTKLGFEKLDEEPSGASRAALSLDLFKPTETNIRVRKV